MNQTLECCGDLWRALLVERRAANVLSATEQQLARYFVEGMEAHLGRCGVALTPLIVLRVHDVLVSFLAALVLEGELGQEEAAPEEEQARSRGRRGVAVGLEALGKARERLRKAMNDLEEACAKAGTPIDRGLADIMKPILKKAHGVLESALAFEAGKSSRRKAHAKPKASHKKTLAE